MKSENPKTGGLPEVWQARWIDPEPQRKKSGKQPASVLRKRFSVSITGAARLFITCHGVYVARLNGKRVGDCILAPGPGNYKKRLPVQTYDVTTYLTEGENELTVTLGDGWYRGSVGVDGLKNYYGRDLALLCQLEIAGTVALVSDESWEASQEGPVRQNDLQMGEEYDARRESITDWHGVRVRNFGYDNLAAADGVPVREHERFPGRLITTPDGSRVIDFGQNLAGYTEIRVGAKAGQRIELWHGETLDENGNFTQENFDPGKRNRNGGVEQKLTYTCREGLNQWKPDFTIFGFRYAKIETDADLTDAEFNAVAVYSDMKTTARFTCGNADVNRLFENCMWSMKSNFCFIPTDCPTRERSGWTGDAAVFAPTAVLLMDSVPVLRNWLAECRLAQRGDGLVPNIAPVNTTGSILSRMLQGSAGWGDACVLVPWAIYEATGELSVLEENYGMMMRWLSFVKKRAKRTRRRNRNNPDREFLVDRGFHFGEWLEPDVNGMEVMKTTVSEGAPEVATAYFFRSASLLARTAALLGKTEDAATYESWAEGARRAYRFTCTNDGAITSERQAEYVRPVAFGLLDEAEAQNAADALAELVAGNGYRLNTGFLSSAHLCRALAEHGHVDTAYRLLLGTDCPGWLHAVRHGATTVPESWDGVREDGTVHGSLNHYAYGAVAGWLIDGVCGIRPREGKLTICPHPHPSLGFARAEWDSPAGTVRSAWEYGDDGFEIEIAVPPDTEAEILLPDGTRETALSGCHRYRIPIH
ncbi:MAG: family 78 glycoside hydrolase catalytic domain [Clostridia bacterium]|nr:family 78 glycoside hydrolase catalytic domain [Clostridia bacterium]